VKALIILAIIAVLSAPYCIDNSVTVGQIAKDVKKTTGRVVDSIQEEASDYSK